MMICGGDLEEHVYCVLEELLVMRHPSCKPSESTLLPSSRPASIQIMLVLRVIIAKWGAQRTRRAVDFGPHMGQRSHQSIGLASKSQQDRRA
jgi:hypothetical protein